MSDFQEQKTRRRGPLRPTRTPHEGIQLEETIARALVSVQEHQDNVRAAWGQLYKDLISRIRASLHCASRSMPQQEDDVASLALCFQEVEVTTENHRKHDSEVDLKDYGSHANRSPVGILCLGLGKPATDRTAQHQLALLLLIADELGASRQSVEIFDPMWDLADVGLIQKLGLTPSSHNHRGLHRVAMDKRPYFLYMPHCPRPLYEAVLTSNWSGLQKSSSRWLLLGNELLDYIPHAVTTRALGPTEQSDMVVVVRSRRARKSRLRPTDEGKVAIDGVLERLAPHLLSYELPASPSGMEHSFASLKFQELPLENAIHVNWDDLPAVSNSNDDEKGEVITSELAFHV